MNPPKGWRKGQFIFNFLAWCAKEGHLPTEQSKRMGDPFHLSDEQYEELMKEYKLQGKGW